MNCPVCQRQTVNDLIRPSAKIAVVFDYPSMEDAQSRSILVSNYERAALTEFSIAGLSPTLYSILFFISHLPSTGKGYKVIMDDCWKYYSMLLHQKLLTYPYILLLGKEGFRAMEFTGTVQNHWGLSVTSIHLPDAQLIMPGPDIKNLTNPKLGIGEMRLTLSKFMTKVKELES